jgi:hypothetical protein
MTKVKKPKLIHHIRVSRAVYRLLQKNGRGWGKSASRYADDEIRRLILQYHKIELPS